ncbi:MAG: cation-translocating P-type ATPase [Clostridiales bacterium]|nr:cation-translocating P-type ATPase [Clostridiales bacterium]
MVEQKEKIAVLNEFEVEQSVGLSTSEAAARLEKYGKNEFEEGKKKTKIQMFLSQLKDPMIYILMVAVVISAALGEISDSIIIVAVILLNAIIGMVQEAKAEASLEALKKMSSPLALVRRDGQLIEIPAPELVPGDIVVLEAGRVVPADLRLLETVNLKVEEAALTGESVPVDKDANFVAEGEVTLGDRINMAYLSTNVSYGRGEGVVVSTGMNTEIGKIAAMLNNAVDDMTPLQKRLADLGKLLGILAVVLCVLLFGLALIQQRDVLDMLLTAISLAVAAIPEGLPAVVTIVLAIGVQRMVEVNTIVRKLPAVETLGAVSVVCSDKTGTLTQNKMTALKVYAYDDLESVVPEEMGERKDEIGKKFDELIKGFIYCSDAEVTEAARIGDPTELAFIDLGINFGVSKNDIYAVAPRINELAFDSDRKLMTTVTKNNETGKVVAYTKGAVDRLIPLCTKIIGKDGEVRPITSEDHKNIEAASHNMALDALRVLALAVKENDDTATEADLTFFGLVGMIDPPRPEAKDAIKVFDGAGVRTIMITGDHKDTAFAIARDLGITDDSNQVISGDELNNMTQEELNARVENLRVFARVSPENKVMIVNAFKSHGYIVSMTGDGVNDAPSLKAADIGVAMGITGTDVAKGAADMVLMDDNFATIKKAIEEGRNIYANIKKSVLFLLSSNLGEIVTMFVSILLGFPAPLAAIHILWINLITDSLPGLALGMDGGDPHIMSKQPRDPKESLFAHGGYATVGAFGVLIGAITIGAFLMSPIGVLNAQGLDITVANINMALQDEHLYMQSQTYAFTVLGISQLFNAAGMRSLDRSFFTINHFNNKMMLLAFAVGFGLQIAVTEINFLEGVFGTTELSISEWGMLTVLAMSPIVLHEVYVLASHIFGKNSKAKKQANAA